MFWRCSTRPARSHGDDEAPIPDDASLVVRGDDLDPETARAQAEAFRERFPDWERYGLSAYFARDDAEIDDLAADQFEWFPSLAIMNHAELDGPDSKSPRRSAHRTSPLRLAATSKNASPRWAGYESKCAPTRIMNESPDAERRKEEQP
jgi:hypothetical protein